MATVGGQDEKQGAEWIGRERREHVKLIIKKTIKKEVEGEKKKRRKKTHITGFDSSMCPLKVHVNIEDIFVLLMKSTQPGPARVERCAYLVFVRCLRRYSVKPMMNEIQNFRGNPMTPQ